MTPRILVSGLEVELQEVLRSELEAMLGGPTAGLPSAGVSEKPTVVFAFPDPPKKTPAEVQREFDLFICFVDPLGKWDRNQAHHVYLGNLIHACGAWACLPTLIVGEPDDKLLQSNPRKYEILRDWTRFYKLRASSYLRAGAVPRAIARDAKRTLNSTWWGGEANAELPVLLVDAAGIIIRANDAAERKFGRKLLNRPYAQTVEKGEGPALPDNHPIMQAIRENKHISCDREYLNPAEQLQWNYLVCAPIVAGLIDQRHPSLAAVTVLELPSWTQLRRASEEFAKARRPEELHDAITRTALSFGFERVRLYQCEDGNRIIRGRAAVGHDSAFRARWEPIPVAGDQPSETTFARTAPCLFICPPTGEAKDTDLVKYIARPPERCLGYKTGVNRWIEAPLILSEEVVEGKVRPHYWGKLSLDRGKASDTLDARDLAGVALFARDAAAALASMDRLEAERLDRKVFRECSKHFVEATERSDAILESVVDQVNQLYLEQTGADCTLYRRYHAPTQTLRLVGCERWLPAAAHEGLAPPPTVTRRGWSDSTEGTPADPFAVLDARSPKPQIDNRIAEKCRAYLAADSAGKLTPEQRAYLERITAEVQIPVFRSGKVCGLVLAVKLGGRFSSDLIPVLERLMHLVSVFVELAEVYGGRAWLNQLLKITITFLPRLAVEADPNAFFAALATILTAHNGIGWNRVYIWSCREGVEASDHAELVYALGGLAGDPNHTDIQDRLEQDPELRDLEAVIEKRLKHPAPISPDGKIADRLYDLCVHQPRVNKARIRFPLESPPAPPRARDHYEEGAERAGGREISAFTFDPVATPVPDEGDTNHPLRWLLQLDTAAQNALPPFPFPVPVPLRDPNAARWFRQMNDRYHDPVNRQLCMFGLERKYAFPMWGSDGHRLHPLGVVVVDVQMVPKNTDADMLAATEFLLGLFSEIFASRCHLTPPFLEGVMEQRERNLTRVLQALEHGRALGIVWSELSHAANKLPDNDPKTAYFRELVAELNPRVNDVVAAQQPVRTTHPHSRDLKAYLIALAAERESAYASSSPDSAGPGLKIDCDVEEVAGVQLPCYPDSLRDVLHNLIKNGYQGTLSRWKAMPADAERTIVKLKLTAKRDREPGCANIQEVITLLVRDYGVGLVGKIRHYAFLDRFSTADAPSQRGGGLYINQKILHPFGAHLAHEEPEDEKELGGAQFAIRFAIPVPLRLA